ncbi:MAG: CvpA family protein [Limimaricola sp.]|uniref:CvpA family protein n=1 Tax=Limimaricola sp. TaxID=2211665 RepID=UPI001D3AC73A|nr:CvpA family protein [Limimaricola sp.]MBI1418458.1 CvpA family protein [Limimaricola sp.]
MDGFTLVDGIVALVIIISAILAYSRGLTRELMAIAGWVAATVVGFVFARSAEPLVQQIPVLGKFIGDSCELSIIAAFAAVFAVALVIFSIFTPLLSTVVQRSVLGGLDQGLGFLFGVARGILLVAVGFYVYATILNTQKVAMIDDSRSAKVFGQMTASLSNSDPESALGWITGQYQTLVGNCGAPTSSGGAPASNGATTGSTGN